LAGAFCFRPIIFLPIHELRSARQSLLQEIERRMSQERTLKRWISASRIVKLATPNGDTRLKVRAGL